jgi:flagellar hook-length control protein FliK
MNLSALNTGLNQATVNNSPEVNTSGKTSLRLPTGSLSGEDFAAFLRNQVRALKNSQRPDIAAAPQVKALPPAEHTAPAAEHEDTHIDDNRSNKLKSQDKQTARQAREEDSAQANAVHKQNKAQDASTDSAEAADSVALQDAGQADLAQAPTVVAVETTSPQQTAADEKALDDVQTLADAAQLTTIPLSSSINIITTAQTAPDDKSLSDFALAMGLDPSQVQALFGSAGTSAPPTLSTKQVLAMNSLPSLSAPTLPMDLTQAATQLPAQSLANVAVSTADFQALKADAPTDVDASLGQAIQTLDILNMQVATGQADASNPMAASAPPVSTLAVLSMMDTQLRAEDIEALKNEFDAVTSLDLAPSDHALPTSGNHTPSVTSANAPSKAAAAFVNNPDMAQTFDKLSQKLATELAGRMHEKLNAGEWKMKFALKPASLGLVDVQLEMRDGKLTAQFNADTNLTQDLIQSGSQRLKEALGQLGMNNASVLVGQGQSQPQGQTSTLSNPDRQGGDNRVKLAEDSVTEPLLQARPRHSNSLQFDNYA